MRYWLIVLAATLAACGGGSSSPPPAQPVVEDTTPPVITLTGDNPQLVEAGEAYNELGATAIDNVDGDLSTSIIVDASTVDTTVPGDYTVTYNVSDASGNTATTVTRTVRVQDTTPPVIKLLGDDPQVIITGNPYTELGATAADTMDGDLTSSIMIDARAVQITVIGDYVVTYNVMDAAGNSAATVTRSVRVQHPSAPELSVSGDVKTLLFTWAESEGAEFYRLLEQNPAIGRYDQLGDDIPAGTLAARRAVAVHLFEWDETQYVIEACNSYGCNRSEALDAKDYMLSAIGYFKASNTEVPPASGVCYSNLSDVFGSVALSADGKTMAVGASGEDSSATGIDGDQADDTACESGAVYVFRFDGELWSQQAYIKASNTGYGDSFGGSIALSADGNTLAVGASGEDSGATGINGDQTDDSVDRAGAVYLFRFDGIRWAQQAYIKAPVTDRHDKFGAAIAVSADGNTLAVGADSESSSATGIDGDATNNWALSAGAVYVFGFDGSDWSQQAYIKASNTDSGDSFGESIALSADGNTLAVGAVNEDSSASGINGDQSNTSIWETNQGAVYVFRFDGAIWAQQAYIKASNPSEGDLFGYSVAISAVGNTIVVGAPYVGNGAGAMYLFGFDGAMWSQLAYAVSPYPGSYDAFGRSVALSADAKMVAVGANNEDSGATGINGDPFDETANLSGAVYLFHFNSVNNTVWPAAYIKASNTSAQDSFGGGVWISGDGATLAVSAMGEDSAATGINGDQADDSATSAGAVYLY